MLQSFYIILHNGVFKHLGIHGRRQDLFAFTRHHRSCQHIVRDTMSDFSDHIGGSRSDHHYICHLRQGNVFYTELKIPIKSIHQTFIPRKRLKCDGIDKIRGIFRHQHLYVRMKFRKLACQCGNLICCNASRNSQHYCFSL